MSEMLLERRLDRLEERVLRVERNLGLAAPPQAEPLVAAPHAARDPQGESASRLDDLVAMRRKAHERHAETSRPAIAPMAPPPLPKAPLHISQISTFAPPPAAPSAPETKPAPVENMSAGFATPQPQQPPAVLAYPAATPRPAAQQSALEQVIGIKWAGWIGAIVLVIGAALGIKYAYDQGLFPTISPSVRLIMMSIGAFGLIGAGEWVFRKVGRLSATGFFGAGVACLFVISYAGHGYWPVYSRDTAFILMALCTLIGAAVAMRAGLVSVAVLSLIGGNLAPIILRGDTANLVPFLSYLLMLQVVALLLAWWGNTGRWWTLRGLSLASTSLWMFTLISRGMIAPWSAGMCFTLLYGVLYQLEVTYSAWRRSRTDAGSGAVSQEAAQNVGAIFSIVATALLSAAVLRIFWNEAPAIRGTWFATFAAIAMLLSILLRRVRAMSISFRLQAAALILVAIPVAMNGPAISFGWAVLALVLAAAGMLLDDRSARATAAVAWVLALCNLLLWSAGHGEAARAIWITIFGQPLAAWGCVAGILALVGHGVALLAGWPTSKDEHQKNEIIALGRSLSFAATAVFAMATVMALPAASATIVLLAYAWILVGADLKLARLLPLAQACAVLVLVTAKWAAIDVLAARLSPGWSAAAYSPVFNPLMGTAVALAGSLVAIYRLRRTAIEKMFHAIGADNAKPTLVSLAILTGILTFGLSFEVDRIVEQATMHVWPAAQMKLMGWTILWSIASAAYLAAYSAIDRSALRRSSWRAFASGLCVLLVIKFIFFDTTMWAIHGAAAHPAALLNMQMLTALILAAMLTVTQWLLSRGSETENTSLDNPIAFLAALVILWAGSFEIARLVNDGLFPGASAWSSFTLKNFALTAWWGAGLCGYIGYATRLDARRAAASRGLRVVAVIVALLGIKFITVDSALSFFGSSSPTVLVNAQAATGALLFASLIFMRFLLPKGSQARAFASAIAVLIPLCCGTIEINRAFERSALALAFADPRLAKQVALSIFFSIYAIGCVALGFQMRAAALRYFGLALFALTLAKVGVLDLSRASTGYRFLSFMGLGGLLLVTSVIYGRLSPRLLRASGVSA